MSNGVPPMNPEVKTKWLTALTSGRYTQTKDALTSLDGAGRPSYCCLGVLCDLAVEEGIIPPPTKNETEDVLQYGESLKTGYLPREVKDWSGVLDSEGTYTVTPAGNDITLAFRNDMGWTFPMIAKAIEENL